MSTKIPAVKPAFKDWNFIADDRLEHRDYETNHAYVSQYAQDSTCAGQWFWNVGSKVSLCGVLPSVDEAVSRCNELVSLPYERFVDEAASKIVKEMEALLNKLKEMGAESKFDPYEIGFAHGSRQTRIEICEDVVKLIKSHEEGV